MIQTFPFLLSFLLWQYLLTDLNAFIVRNKRTPYYYGSYGLKLSLFDSKPNFFTDIASQLLNKVDPESVYGEADLASLTAKLLSKSSQAIETKFTDSSKFISNIDVESLMESFITKCTSLFSNSENMINDYIHSMQLTVSSVVEYPISREAVWHFLELLAADPLFLPGFTLVSVVLVLAGVGYDDELVGNPYSQTNPRFDAKLANIFYGARPLFVFRRLVRLALLTGGFNTKLLLDWKTGNLEKNEKERAKEALALATKLGPTFIKLGLFIKASIIVTHVRMPHHYYYNIITMYCRPSAVYSNRSHHGGIRFGAAKASGRRAAVRFGSRKEDYLPRAPNQVVRRDI